MILDGKALEDFNLWHFESGNVFEYKNFHELSDNLKNAIIIQFFDSVGIYISTRNSNNKFMSYITNNEFSFYGETRQQATKAAIIKTNEI